MFTFMYVIICAKSKGNKTLSRCTSSVHACSDSTKCVCGSVAAAVTYLGHLFRTKEEVLYFSLARSGLVLHNLSSGNFVCALTLTLKECKNGGEKNKQKKQDKCYYSMLCCVPPPSFPQHNNQLNLLIEFSVKGLLDTLQHNWVHAQFVSHPPMNVRWKGKKKTKKRGMGAHLGVGHCMHFRFKWRGALTNAAIAYTAADCSEGPSKISILSCCCCCCGGHED